MDLSTTTLAKQFKEMGFNPATMHWHSINDSSLLRGDICYYDHVSCKGELKKHGDYMQVNFMVTKPTNERPASLNEIVVLLIKKKEPIPVMSKKYENGIYPNKAQIIEHMEQAAKAVAISKKFKAREPAGENKQKLSSRK